MVAGFDVANQIANLLHDAGGLMAEQGRDFHRDQALDVMQIAMTNAARLDLDQYLVVLGPIHFDLVYQQRLMGAIKHCGFHD